MNTESGQGRGAKKIPVGILALAFFLPTAITWIYFTLLSSSPPSVQQAAFASGKSIQFGLPLLAAWLWRETSPKAKVDYRKSLASGAVLGLLIGGATLALFHFILAPWGWMEVAKTQAIQKMEEIGIPSKTILVGVAIFYSLIHSGLEEYYWRWFLFRRLQERVSLPWSYGISSIGFMAHHVLVLSRFFGWSSPLTYFFSLAIVVGGLLWAYVYRRFGSILGPWLSHAWVDAAIFAVAYSLADGM